MNEKTTLKEGETLLILQRKSGKSVAEVAKLLDIHPNHLSKIFKIVDFFARINEEKGNRDCHAAAAFEAILSTA